MNKTVLTLGVLGVGGFIAYKYFSGKQLQQAVTPAPTNMSPAVGGQPQNQYPFQILPQPRVDTSNQPWYGGNRNFIQQAVPGPALSDIGQAADITKSVASITDSVTSMWSDLSDYFGSDQSSPSDTVE